MKNTAHQTNTTAPTSFHKEILRILQAMHEASEFQAAILTLPDGLPLAIVPTDYGGDVAAAIAAMLRKVSDRAQSQLGMGEVDEVTIRDCNHTRLACRHIPDKKKGMILAVIVPAGRPYRRATNQAVRQIKQLLS